VAVVVVEFDVEVLLVGAAKEGVQRDKMRVVIMLQNIVYKLNNESGKEENAHATSD